MESGVHLSPIDTSVAWHSSERRLTKLRAAFDKHPSACVGDDNPLRKTAARQLASLFIYRLLRAMRKTIPESGLWDGGRTQDIYEQMVDERLADMIAATGQFGLTEMIREELLKYS